MKWGWIDRGSSLFLSQLTAPDIAVITMIGEAHIEFFGTRDKIADAKMEIIQSLKADGTFIYDGDEPLLTVRAQTVDQQQVTFGQQATTICMRTRCNQPKQQPALKRTCGAI